MRTFVAVELPETVKHLVVARQRHLQQQFQSQGIPSCVRWTPAANLHLTLRFLGDTTDAQRKQVMELFTQAANRCAVFTMAVQQLGCFPNFRRPNIVWLDCGGELPVLLRLQQAIENAVQAVGFAGEERAFTPHLTIGRANRSAASTDLQRAGELLRQLAAAPAAPVQGFVVDHFAFIKSELQPEGPVYTPLAQFPLAG
jgi:2'-5' RNA ligase